MTWRYFVYGAISGIMVGLLITGILLCWSNGLQNNEIHSKTITISRILCGDEVLGSNLSKLIDTEGNRYFINSYEDCEKFGKGDLVKINYTHTHQLLSIGSYFDFESIVFMEGV
jgi:hypothetical protein